MLVIPPTIHRYWQGPPPHADYRSQLVALNPGVEVVEWAPESLPIWITELARSTAPYVTKDRQAVHWSNVARAGLLWQYGGWWADHDIEPFESFTSLPSPATGAHSDGTRCCCWLAFPAQHEATRSVLDAIATASLPVQRAIYVSGERVWQRATAPNVPAVKVSGWAIHHAWSTTARRRASRNR